MKYVIDVPEEMITSSGELMFHYKNTKDLTYQMYTGINTEPYIEPDRKQIEDEVWKFARVMFYPKVIGGIYAENFNECYHGKSAEEVLKDMSYEEAKIRYDAWKASGDKESPVEVGDEVIAYDDIKAVVMDILKNGELIVFAESGCIERWAKTHRAEKTGRTFPQVEDLLKAMKGKE